MAKIGKRIKTARQAVSGKENVTVEEAVALVKTSASARFDETVEIAMTSGSTPATRTRWSRHGHAAERNRQGPSRGRVRARGQG